MIQITKATAYIGAESDGKGNWKWNDGSKWWQPAGTQHDGIAGTGETKIAVHTDKKWHDWNTGGTALAVLCAKDVPNGTVCIKCGVCRAPVVVCVCCYEFPTAVYDGSQASPIPIPSLNRPANAEMAGLLSAADVSSTMGTSGTTPIQ